MEHRVTYQVYYEDTDCLGVVYHANYLKYFERGRTEFVTSTGKSLAQWNREGVAVVVYAMQIKFKKPAVLQDELEVVSTFRVDSGYRGTFSQRIERGGELLVDAEVEVVCLDERQQLRELPAGLRALAQDSDVPTQP
jgi:acyl-CoA thioester hydrolase